MNQNQGNESAEKTRRDFLKAGLLGTAALAFSSQPVQAADSPLPLIPQRPLGKTGVMVSSLSMGTMFDTITNQAVLRLAARLGITHWDTAESYEGGRAEEGIGQFFKRNPNARKEIFLVTKSYSLKRTVDEMRTHLEESMARMRVGYVDAFFVHGIDKIEDVDRPEVKAWAAEIKAAGKVKFFGFSAHRNMAQLLSAAAKMPWLDNIMFSYNYRLMQIPAINQAVQAAYDAGIGLVAMKTQGEHAQLTEGSSDNGLAGAFEQQGFSPEQARLKAVWEDKRIASICSQMPNLAIMQANADAAMNKARLSQGQKGALALYAEETSHNYCAGCADLCEDILDAPMADIMRALMYYQSYGRPQWSRELLAGLNLEKINSITREQLARAVAACPQGVDMARALERAKEIVV